MRGTSTCSSARGRRRGRPHVLGVSRPKHPRYTEALNKKYGRVVEDTYIKMDGIVGKVMERLQPTIP